MTAKIIELCDAITSELNDRLDLSAKRAYELIGERERLTSTVVTVFPNASTREPANRAANTETLEVNVIVQRAVTLTDIKTIDACVDLVDDIKQLFDDGGALRDESLADCDWVGLSNDPLWNGEALQSAAGEFRSVITLTYQHET